MIEEILTIARGTLGDQKLRSHSRFEDAAGYDSMALIQFVIELQAHFDVNLEDEDILAHFTFEDVMNLIKKKRG